MDDFIVSDGKTRRVEDLIRFIDDNTVEIVYNMDHQHPVSFDPQWGYERSTSSY